ncbi:MAG: hypothetical protein NVS4B7_11440 [Ktedonobacteraceae bacterium]
MTAMAAKQSQTPKQIPVCPVCHKDDQVKTAQAAYQGGVTQLVPPPLPGHTAAMMPWIVTGALIYGGANFYLLVQLGGGPGFSSWPFPFQELEVGIIEGMLVLVLVLSFIAFRRIVQADRETEWLYPVYDQAMEHWRGLYYCERDKVVFDPQQKKVLSNAELQTLLSVQRESIPSSMIKTATKSDPDTPTPPTLQASIEEPQTLQGQEPADQSNITKKVRLP